MVAGVGIFGADTVKIPEATTASSLLPGFPSRRRPFCTGGVLVGEAVVGEAVGATVVGEAVGAAVVGEVVIAAAASTCEYTVYTCKTKRDQR
eukprot:6591447-Pyramimonas_sp.AAC.1